MAMAANRPAQKTRESNDPLAPGLASAKGGARPERLQPGPPPESPGQPSVMCGAHPVPLTAVVTNMFVPTARQAAISVENRPGKRPDDDADLKPAARQGKTAQNPSILAT